MIQQFQTLTAAAIGGVIAIWYNRKKMDLDKRVFKRELFEKFNVRYDVLNDRLLSLRQLESKIVVEHRACSENLTGDVWEDIFTSTPFKYPEEEGTVYDYINLCSEEYYWYKMGFVECDVWNCWHSGMIQWYSRSVFVKKIVESEIRDESPYYNKDFFSIWNV